MSFGYVTEFSKLYKGRQSELLHALELKFFRMPGHRPGLGNFLSVVDNVSLQWMGKVDYVYY